MESFQYSVNLIKSYFSEALSTIRHSKHHKS